MKKIFSTTLKEILWEAVQVKAQSIYLIAYVYHRLYFINGKLSKIKLANKKHALAFINKINIQFKSSFYGDCRDARQKYLKSDNIYFVNWGTND